MITKRLDGFTLRTVVLQLEERAERFRRIHAAKGWSQRHHFLHRAAELEDCAGQIRDGLLNGSLCSPSPAQDSDSGGSDGEAPAATTGKTKESPT